MSNTAIKPKTKTLKELRLAKGVNQTAHGLNMDVIQRRVSTIELSNPGSLHVATVRKYVEALGGALKVLVEIDGATHELDLEDFTDAAQ